MKLITIPPSHYCEKARWALRRAGARYVEDAHAPLFHRFATMPVGGTTVPVLVDGSEVVKGSDLVVRHLDAKFVMRLYPEEQLPEICTLVQMFDELLGPHLRRWALHYLLQDREIAVATYCAGVPAWERRVFSGIFPLFRWLARRAMRIDETRARRSFVRMQEVFNHVESALSDGRRFLTGDTFTAADLTFAALASPLMIRDPREKLFPAADLQQLRESVAGRYVARLLQVEGRT